MWKEKEIRKMKEDLEYISAKRLETHVQKNHCCGQRVPQGLKCKKGTHVYIYIYA